VLLEYGDRTNSNGQYVSEVMDLLKELVQLDPDHMFYYESIDSSLLIAKVGCDLSVAYPHVTKSWILLCNFSLDGRVLVLVLEQSKSLLLDV
jgi:hypothetical protein